MCFTIEKAFSVPKAARCQVTEHCCHPSLNAQHPYKDYSLLLAAPDISRIYISSRTIHLWTVQVTNVEYIVLRATFGRQRLTFDALPCLSYIPWRWKFWNYIIIISRAIFHEFLYVCKVYISARVWDTNGYWIVNISK